MLLKSYTNMMIDLLCLLEMKIKYLSLNELVKQNYQSTNR